MNVAPLHPTQFGIGQATQPQIPPTLAPTAGGGIAPTNTYPHTQRVPNSDVDKILKMPTQDQINFFEDKLGMFRAKLQNATTNLEKQEYSNPIKQIEEAVLCVFHFSFFFCCVCVCVLFGSTHTQKKNNEKIVGCSST